MPRYFRIAKANPPTEWDLKTHTQRGTPLPRRASADLRLRWGQFSVTTTLELAAEYASQWRLGEWAAELDVPGTVEVAPGRTGRLGRHDELIGTTPERVRRYIVAVHRLALSAQGVE